MYLTCREPVRRQGRGARRGSGDLQGRGNVQAVQQGEGVQFLLKMEVGYVQGEQGDSRSSCEPGAPATADEVEDEVPVFPGRRGYVK